MKKYIVTLTEDEREILSILASKGKHKSQKILNALVLIGCDEGEFRKKRCGVCNIFLEIGRAHV